MIVLNALNLKVESRWKQIEEQSQDVFVDTSNCPERQTHQIQPLT